MDISSGLHEVEASSVTNFQKSDVPCVNNIVVVSKDHACMLNEIKNEGGFSFQTGARGLHHEL